MCLEVAFKNGKSLRRSDGLWETVPDCRTDNRKGSVYELGHVRVYGTTKSSCWWNEDVVPGRYWQTQRILSGILRGSDCRDL